MKIKAKFHTLSKLAFEAYLEHIKSDDDTIVIFKASKKEYFYRIDQEINQYLLDVVGKQKTFDSLVNSLSTFARKQLIQSYLLSEIIATNEIENIHSTKHDVFEIMNRYKNNASGQLIAIINSYKLLLNENGLVIESIDDIRRIYNLLLGGAIMEEDLPDGELFRKKPVYISDGLNVVHKGFTNEYEITKGMEEFVNLYNSNLEVYEKMILAHFIFETVHPFYDGNGRLGRFLQSACLYQSNKTYLAFLLSSIFAKYKSQYYKAFKLAHDYDEFGSLNDYVLKMLQIIDKGYEESIINLEKKISTVNSYLPIYPLTKSQQLIYSLLAEATIFSDYGVNTNEIIETLGLGKRNVIYCLNDMKDKDILEETKLGRIKYYKLKTNKKPT